MQNILITGVSSGIGLAAAKCLVDAGYRVFGTLQKAGHAQELEAELGRNFSSIIVDLANPEAVDKAARAVRTALDGAPLKAIVNNAGVSALGPAMLQNMAEFRNQMEVNFFAPLALMRLLFPCLCQNGDKTGAAGRIINVTSVSGRIAPPFMGGYSASKHALEALSCSLRIEVAPLRLKVIIIEPGPIATPLWAKCDLGDEHFYQGSPFGSDFSGFQRMFMAVGRKQSLAPVVAAEIILKALETPRPKNRYTVMRAPFFNLTLPRLLPDRVMDAFWRRQIRKGD